MMGGVSDVIEEFSGCLAIYGDVELCFDYVRVLARDNELRELERVAEKARECIRRCVCDDDNEIRGRGADEWCEQNCVCPGDVGGEMSGVFL